jgi:SAM-dependent methyltransferase
MGERNKDIRFDAAWLKAREVADERARNKAIAESLRSYFSIRADMAILDLGCGIGANLRGLYPFLPTFQRWTLVEPDRDLLDAARGSLMAWADTAKQKSRRDDVLVLEKGEYRIEVSFRAADLSKHLDQLLDA